MNKIGWFEEEDSRMASINQEWDQISVPAFEIDKSPLRETNIKIEQDDIIDPSENSVGQFLQGANLEMMGLCKDDNLEASSIAQNLESSTVGLTNQPQDSRMVENKRNQEIQYSKGHLLYLIKIKCPIFPLSRKIMKTKRKAAQKKGYYHQASYFMDNKSDTCKKFDQKKQHDFEKMSPEEQEEKDDTYESLRQLLKINDDETKKLLDRHKKSYLQSRAKAMFIDFFVNGK